MIRPFKRPLWRLLAGLILLVFSLASRGFCLSIAAQPPSLDLVTNPGGIKTFRLELTNADAGQRVNVKVYTETVQISKNGEIAFIAQDQQPQGSAGWIKARSAKVSLGPLQKKNVPFRLRVPPGTASGGYYAAIIVEPDSKAPVTATGLRIAFRLATIVRITVKGSQPLERTLEVSDFFYLSGPIDPRTLSEAEAAGIRGKVAHEFPNTKGLFLVALLTNPGNIHFKAEGTVLVRDEEQRRKADVEMRGGTGIVYPGAGRYFIARVPGILAEGDYAAQLRFRYGGPRMFIEDRPFSIEVASGKDDAGVNVFLPLEVTPAALTVEVPSGGNRTQKYLVTNRLKENVDISLSAQGAAKDWIELIKPAIQVPSAREGSVVFRVNVPADAKAGVYNVKIVMSDEERGIEESVPLDISVMEWDKL